MHNSIILVTGGTGKTGSRVAAQLKNMGYRTRIASRKVNQFEPNIDRVRFDWADASTYETTLHNISAIYAVAPENVASPLSAMQPFLDKAINNGVKRIVLLSASSLEEGDPMMGEVHAYLKQYAPEWAALRPTWFMQNFSELQHLPTIRDEGRIYSATADGRVPFVDADDIASVATVALTNAVSFNRDIIITGSESLSYDQAAAIISGIICRPVEHIRLSESELIARHTSMGIELQYAEILSAMDIGIANGSEDRVSDEVVSITGKTPIKLSGFSARCREVWITSC